MPSLLFALALGVRLLPHRFVTASELLLLPSFDAWYHLRRIVYTLTHFPAVLDFDLYINFPDGARPIWTPVFDWCVALLLWPFSLGRTPREVELLASFVPPALGGATVVALYLVARSRFGFGVAGLAALILAVLPAHFWYSQQGFIDHHCAVALATTLLLGAAMRFVDRAPQTPSGACSGLAGAIPLGSCLALPLLVWPGALLHVGIVFCALLALLLCRREREPAIALARRLGVAQLVAAALVAPFALGVRWPQWSAQSPVVLSDFQPWLFASAGAFGFGCATLWTRVPGSGASVTRRAGSAIAIGLAIVAASALIWPELGTGVFEAWAWLGKTDAFQAMVGESTPLFLHEGAFSSAAAVTNLSWFVFAVPLALLAHACTARRDAAPASLLLALWWTLVLCAATLLQRRFANSASVALALLFALTLCRLHGLVRRRTLRPAPRLLAGAALALAALAALWPSLLFYLPLISSLTERDGPLVLQGALYERHAMAQTARWLRENTPPTSGWLDASAQPEYGVVAPWDMGHLIQYLGRRPTSTNNFGDDIGSQNFLLVQEYFGAREDRASEILARLQGRYVVVPWFESFLARPPAAGSMQRALFRHDGSEYQPQGASASERVPALRRHRLLYEYARTTRGRGQRPLFKVFEHVPGASIVGRAAPGAEILASLAITTELGRQISWESRTTASEDGRYLLQVPYANERGQGAVQPDEHYELRCGRDGAHARVGQRDVGSGRRVPGPDLCLVEVEAAEAAGG